MKLILFFLLFVLIIYMLFNSKEYMTNFRCKQEVSQEAEKNSDVLFNCTEIPSLSKQINNKLNTFKFLSFNEYKNINQGIPDEFKSINLS